MNMMAVLVHTAAIALTPAPKVDPLKLSCRGSDLARALKVPEEDLSLTVEKLCALYNSEIAFLEHAIWDSQCAETDRISAIEQLSDALDRLEVQACGPLLAGKRVSLADAIVFPSFCLITHALPQHFGWTEWTDEVRARSILVWSPPPTPFTPTHPIRRDFF